jgi:hypothetical protein
MARRQQRLTKELFNLFRERRRLLISTMALLVPIPAMADNWFIAPEYSYTWPDDWAFKGDDQGVGISGGRQYSDGAEIELSYSVNELIPRTTPGLLKQRLLTLGGRWNLNGTEGNGPFAGISVGAARAKLNGESETLPLASLGAGYTLELPFIKNLQLQNEIRGRYLYDDDRLTGDKNLLDAQALVKVRYLTPAAPSNDDQIIKDDGRWAPVGSPADPNRETSLKSTCGRLSRGTEEYVSYDCAAFEDKDRDGVRDADDRCPSTIPRVNVDGDGCMIGTS